MQMFLAQTLRKFLLLLSNVLSTFISPYFLEVHLVL